MSNSPSRWWTTDWTSLMMGDPYGMLLEDAGGPTSWCGRRWRTRSCASSTAGAQGELPLAEWLGIMDLVLGEIDR